MNNQQYDEQQPRRHIPSLKIIGTVLLVMVLICGGLVTYAVYQFPRWASALARGPLVSMIDQTGLPDSQKVSIKQNVARVADAFQDGRMSYTQFKAILQGLHNGPFFQLIMIEALRHQYTIAHTTMDEDRSNTMLAMDRFQRGIVEKLIPQRAVANVLALIPDPDQDKPGQKADTIDEADLKPAIDAIKAAVESAAIPAEPFMPDFAEEVDRVVSAVLGSTTTKPTETQPATTRPTESAPADKLTDNTQASRAVLRNDREGRLRAAGFIPAFFACTDKHLWLAKTSGINPEARWSKHKFDLYSVSGTLNTYAPPSESRTGITLNSNGASRA